MIHTPETDWRQVRLGDIAKVFSGYAFKSKDFQNDGIPVIKIRNVRVGHVDLSDAQCVDTSFLSLTERYHVRGGDLLISLTGSHLSVPTSVVGRIAIHSYYHPSCLLNQRAGKIVANPDDCNNRFLFYLLGQKTKAIAMMARGGAGQANVSPTQVESLELLLPPLPTQHKIAAVLSAYDDLIENNTRRIKILEDMAQTIYREWFVHFRFPGHENVKMVESELGLIPEGWKVKQLGDVVSEIIDYRGKTPKKLGGNWSESGIMALSAMNVKQGRLVSLEKAKFVSEELYERWMKSEVAKNDILMTSEAPLGEVYYLADKKKICLSQRLFCIRANPNIIKPSVLFSAIGSPETQKQIHARATGTTVLGIRQAALRKVPVIIPTLQLQSKAESTLGTLITTKETLEKKNANLRQTRDLLLPKLISGEIDVSHLDIVTD